MTNREFYLAVASMETASNEVRDFAVEAIAKMDSKQAQSRANDSMKRATENAPIISAISEFLKTRTEVVLTSEVASAVGISTSKASALLRKMANDGLVIVSDVKVPKSGVRKAYKWM